MNIKKYCFFLLLFIIISSGCKQRAVTQPDTQTQQPATKQGQEQQTGKPSEKITEKGTEAISSKDVTGKTDEEKEGVFKDIFFDFDKYDVRDDFRPALQSISSWMSRNKDAKLSVEGHCDDRGTNEYNLALGDRRAKAVKDYLLSLGVPSSRIETISYGEEKPVCNEHTDECWAKNRRAHFVVLTPVKK